MRGTLSVLLNPGSVALFTLHEKPNTPWVISTDRHYCQGALELESVEWDEGTSTLRGRSLGAPDSRHSLAVYVPEGYNWPVGAGFKRFRDSSGYSVKRIEPRLLRVHVSFDKGERVRWEVKFSKSAPSSGLGA